jgi:rfaE bifunctional protein kinase chain/domain
MNLTKSNIEKDQIDFPALKNIVSRFKQARILVIGDLIVDEYLRGTPERISREAPVIILQYINSRFTLGGSANAANNLASLSAKTSLMGVVGEDKTAERLRDICKERDIELYYCIDPSRPTTLKTRVISSSSSDPDTGTVLKQQVLRIDHQIKDKLNDELSKKLLESFKDTIQNYDLILLSDYGSGVLHEENVKEIMDLAKYHQKKVVVDSNGKFSKYAGAYCLTPNQPDVEATLGWKIKTEEDLFKAGIELLNLIGTEQMLITRGAKGMVLFTKSEDGIKAELIPAFNVSEVFDVSGAGDTVSACFSLALAVGATNLEATLLGNIAASIVVRKYGTATTNVDELLHELDFKEKAISV